MSVAQLFWLFTLTFITALYCHNIVCVCVCVCTWGEYVPKKDKMPTENFT